MPASETILIELQATARARPQDPAAWLVLAEALVQHGDTQRGALALRHAHALNAEGPEELVRVSSAYVQLDNLAEAHNAARRAQHLDPTLESAALATADIVRRSGDPEAAILSLRVALHQHPESGAVHLALAEAHLDANSPQEALRHAERANRHSKNDPHTVRLLAEIFRQLGHDAPETNALRELVRLQPADDAISIRLGERLAHQGRIQEAAAVLIQVAEKPPRDPTTLISLGHALTQAQALMPAVKCLRQAIRIAPDAAQAHLRLGVALRQGGLIHEAIGSLRTAAELAPEESDISFTLGLALREAGQSREAAAALIKAAAAAPDDERIQDILAETLAAMRTPSSGVVAVQVPTGEPVPAEPMPNDSTDGGFTGDLAVFSLPELMEFLTNQSASGEVRVTSPEGEASLQLHEGAIAAVDYPGSKSLGQRLVDAELVTPTALKSCVVSPEDLGRDAVVARVVLDNSLVDRDRVEDVMRRRVLEGVCELVSWETGAVTFKRYCEPRSAPEVEVDTRWALLEAMRLIDEREK